MPTPSITSPRRVSSTLIILPRQKAATSTLPTSTLIQLDSSTLVQLDFATPTSQVSDASTSDTLSSSAGSYNTCTTDSDCVNDTTCSGGSCTNSTNAGLLGSGPEATSRLDTGTAVGIGVGVVVFILVLIMLGFWFFRSRNRQLPPLAIRPRSQSIITTYTLDNDQKTLVASMPNTPRHTGFDEQYGMPAEFYVGTAAMNDRRVSEVHGNEAVREEGAGEKNLTVPNKVLPRPPAEEKRYTLNVNINKSMLFDEEAARMVRESMNSRERAPRYRFKEVLPPIPSESRKSMAQQTISSRHNSEYELDRVPTLNEPPKTNSWVHDDLENQGQAQPVDQRISVLSTLMGGGGGGPTPLSLLDVQPPSPSFSFRSYDWYQDIIGDPTASESPTTPNIPRRSPARMPNPLAANPPAMSSSHLFAPPSPGLLSPRLPSNLHSNSAAEVLSPTNPNFLLLPTVYREDKRSSISEINSRPPSLLDRVADLSYESRRRSRVQSQITQRTHNSRSWLPDEGLYLADEGAQDTFEMYVRRPSFAESGRHDVYSPLV